MAGRLQSAAQQAQEDEAIASQVRREMWDNLQGILAMLAGQGCSPHVQDMVHQIAVHFANEQSQSVALERRMACNLNREKEAGRRMQLQLQGGVQVHLWLHFFLKLLTKHYSFWHELREAHVQPKLPLHGTCWPGLSRSWLPLLYYTLQPTATFCTQQCRRHDTVAT